MHGWIDAGHCLTWTYLLIHGLISNPTHAAADTKLIFTLLLAHGDMFSCSCIENDIYAPALIVCSHWRIAPALHQVAVVWYHSDGAKLSSIDGWLFIKLATAVGGELGFWDSEVFGSKLVSNWWSNSLMTGIALLLSQENMLTCILHTELYQCFNLDTGAAKTYS